MPGPARVPWEPHGGAPLKIEVRIERKQAQLPAFVVVPAARLRRWKLTATTTVDACLDGVALGRRSLLRADDQHWFLELRAAHLAAVGKAPGQRATLEITRASTALPPELQALLDADPAARACWQALTAARQRMLREELLALKTAPARARRARRALLPDPEPQAPPPPVAGLTAEPRPLLVRLQARRLPGTTCGPYTEVAVGLVEESGRPPARLVPGDARTARWETRVEVRLDGARPVFRGPAVNGRAPERFLYLTWSGRLGGAAPAMFRRAKLRLDAIPSDVLAQALRSGVLIGKLPLTAADGMPVCASVRPPAIAWAAGGAPRRASS